MTRLATSGQQSGCSCRTGNSIIYRCFRTDNDVKNHFYSKIRKGLRKINKVIKDNFKKQFKEIKPTVLYKLIQGAEDRFSENQIYDQDVRNFCVQAKNTLLLMSYDEMQYNQWNDFQANQDIIKEFIENLSFFSRQFKRKPKSNAIIGGKRVELSQLPSASLHLKGQGENAIEGFNKTNTEQKLVQYAPTRSPNPLLHPPPLFEFKRKIQQNNIGSGYSICNDSQQVESSQFDDSPQHNNSNGGGNNLHYYYQNQPNNRHHQFEKYEQRHAANMMNHGSQYSCHSQCHSVSAGNSSPSSPLSPYGRRIDPHKSLTLPYKNLSIKEKLNPVIILKSNNHDLKEMIQQKYGQSKGNSSTNGGQQPDGQHGGQYNSNTTNTSISMNETSHFQQPTMTSNNSQLLSSTSNPNKLFPLPSNIPKLVHTTSYPTKRCSMMIDQQHQNNQERLEQRNDNAVDDSGPQHDPYDINIIVEKQLMANGILQEDDGNDVNNNGLLFSGGKNITSKGSNFSSYSIDQEEEVHFFDDDSTLNMRIYTTGVGGRKIDANFLEYSVEKSDKLFKSIERSQQLFDSLGKQHKNRAVDFQMSAQQKSSQLSNSMPT